MIGYSDLSMAHLPLQRGSMAHMIRPNSSFAGLAKSQILDRELFELYDGEVIASKINPPSDTYPRSGGAKKGKFSQMCVAPIAVAEKPVCRSGSRGTHNRHPGGKAAVNGVRKRGY